MRIIKPQIPGITKALVLLKNNKLMQVKTPTIFILLPAILVGLAMTLPLVYLFVRTLGASDEAWRLLFRIQTVYTLARTTLLIITVTSCSIAIGVPLAWLTGRTNLPFRKAWTVLLSLPLVIPSFVGAFLIVSALGPTGLLQQLLSGPFNIDRIPEIYGLPGATLTLALLCYPYVFLTVKASISGLDPTMEESSRSLGHGPWKTFVFVTLPQLRPSIAAGSLLVALYTLSDFGGVSLLRFPTFTWVIYQQYQTTFDRSVAALLSLVLVALAVLILVMENVMRGRQKYYQTSAGTSRQPRLSKLNHWKWPALAFSSTIVTFGLFIPTTILIYWLTRGLSYGESLPTLWVAAWNSVYVSGLAALIVVMFSIPVAILIVRQPSILTRCLEPITYIGYALPGIVIALTLVYIGASYFRIIYQTLWMLLFAYFVLFFPISVGAIRSSLLQISPKLEDAARGLGRTWAQTTWSITTPLMRPGLLIGGMLVFLTVMKELPSTLIISPLGFKTLATVVWSASSEAFFAQAAAPALVLILLSSVPMTIFVTRWNRLGI